MRWKEYTAGSKRSVLLAFWGRFNIQKWIITNSIEELSDIERSGTNNFRQDLYTYMIPVQYQNDYLDSYDTFWCWLVLLLYQLLYFQRVRPIRSDLTNIFAARKDFIISTPVFSHGAKISITVSLYMIIDKNNKKWLWFKIRYLNY